MGATQSKLTSQGQISVPAEIRRRLGIGPGSVLVWEVRDGEVVVRRAGTCTSEEIHAALFAQQVTGTKRPTDVKAGIRKYIRRRHARG
jgi:AbrB family looped-hinge helix DNA binding protein